MSTFVPRVTRVDVIEPYRLAVGFVDGLEQRIDFEPLLHGRWFGALRDLSAFRGVAIDPQGSLVWPNGVTVSLWTLHDWPNAGARLVADVRKNERRMRWSRNFQKWLTVICSLWFAQSLAQWAGWFGDGSVPARDVLMSAALLGVPASSLIQERSTAWGIVLLVVTAGLLVTSVSLR